MSTLSLLLHGFVSLCSPPCNRQDGVHPQNRSWRRPQCQNHSNFTTHGTCEHDTVARWWIILSRPGPSEMNVLAPHYLILLIHSPYSCLVWISPCSQKHSVTHEPSGSKPDKFTMLHFWLCLTYVGLFTMCAFDRDIRLRDGTTRKQKIKDFGCGLHKIIAGWENMKKKKKTFLRVIPRA